MIRAQDLRINNLIKLNGIEMKVASIRNDGTFYCNFDGNEFGAYAFSEISPGCGIPITEELLLKCGFEKGDYNEFRHTDLIGTLTLYDGICEIHLGDLYSVWIESLHKLQNLFYSLTGKELEVKL